MKQIRINSKENIQETKALSKNKKNINCTLTEREKKIYGNRCPNEYQKIQLLGKGGWALVWLVKHIESGIDYALKQFPKNQESFSTSKIEIKIFEEINSLSDSQHPGHTSISHLINKINYK